MPGSTPATSQLDWLISTTAMIVLSWSKATRDLLKSFGWGIRALHQLVAATMVPSPRRLPHTISPLEEAGFEPSVPRQGTAFFTEGNELYPLPINHQSRRRCTRTSSKTPVWSTARHNQCFSRGRVNYDRRDRVEFAPDSPLEGDGFELPVPGALGEAER